MKKKGKEGEDLACEYLMNKGYELLHRNYRYKRGEVDIIVKKNDRICFVEVKMRSRSDYGLPETFVNAKQQKLILAAADNYIHEMDWHNDVRFDVIAIQADKDNFELVHFEDAFY